MENINADVRCKLRVKASLGDYTMCSFAWGDIICWNMLVTTTASVSTY